MIRWCLVILGLALIGAGAVCGDDSRKLKDKKQELDRIKAQLSETRDKVDSLHQLETNLQKTISQYGERVDRNRKLVSKLERQLADVRGALSDNSENLQKTEERLARKRAGYHSLLIDFYRRKRMEVDFDLWDFGQVMSKSRMICYLESISGRSTREIAQVDDSVRLLTQFADSLEQTGTDLSRLRKEKKAKIDLDLTLKQKEETSLGNVRRQADLLQDRLASLSEAAREMENIIATLEQAQERRRQEGITARYRAGSFAQLKGSLLPPIPGQIVSSFGWKKDKVTKLSSFSPGIDIKPSAGRKEVKASAPGRVVYVGRLRGYENFVIIEHDDSFYTTYAGLSGVSVEMDELVDAGDIVGTRGENDVHFEIRKGREHLDPVIWLDINGF